MTFENTDLWQVLGERVLLTSYFKNPWIDTSMPSILCLNVPLVTADLLSSYQTLINELTEG